MEDKQIPDIRLHDVFEARKRISPLVRRSPLIKSSSLLEKMGSTVFMKLETVNEVGSFKIRGAMNKMKKISKDEQRRGVTTFSTGNHGLAVAHIANQLGIRAVICISKRVPQAKVAILKRLGAEVEIVGDGQDDAAKHCYHLQHEEGLTLIPPFDDRDIITGQGTIALELLEDIPDLDEVIIPLSGGGLLAGIAFTIKQIKPTVKITGVSINEASAMSESIKAGKPVEVPEKKTLADSLLGGVGLQNQYTLEMVRTYMDNVILLSEDAILNGMRHLLETERIVSEGAGASGVAALLERGPQEQGKSIAVIISGNNLDWKQFFNAICQRGGEM